MDKLLKIGIPIMIVLLMLVVVGTGVLLAKEQDTSALARPAASYAGYSTGTWVGCGGSGTGAGYGPGGCCGGGSAGTYQGTYPSCHGY